MGEDLILETLLTMSKQEPARFDVMVKLDEKRIKQKDAAQLLSLTV